MRKSKGGEPFIMCPLNPHPNNPNPRKYRAAGRRECTFVYGEYDVNRWRAENLPQPPTPPPPPTRLPLALGPFVGVQRRSLPTAKPLVGMPLRPVPNPEPFKSSTYRRSARIAAPRSPTAPGMEKLLELIELAELDMAME